MDTQLRVPVGSIDDAAQPRKQVYDILNCGPRHRFVVLGETRPFIVHNCVQAIARDIIAEQALNFLKTDVAKRNGITHPALTVHDELVYVVPERDAEEALHALLEVMKTPPTWWPEIVLWAEGDIADTYGAAK